MKKLMTMLAAAAMSFGLFAEEVTPPTLPVGTSFETLTKGEVAAGDIEGALWSTTDDAAKLEAVDGVILPYSASPSESIGQRLPLFKDDLGDVNNVSLKVKTAFDKPLYRSETWAWDSEKGIYFDALVNFTFCDEAPAAAEQGVKLMLWAQDLSDAETPAAETNLYVRALCGETAKDYLIGSADEGVHRITVKMIPTITKTQVHPGFVIFKDGVACQCKDATYDIGYGATDLNTKAAKFFNDKTLFVSLDQNSDNYNKLTAIGFAGQGVIDDVAITDVAPVVAAADPIVQQITLAEGVSSVKWNDTTYETTFEAIVDGGVVALDEVNYAAGYTNPADWDMSTRQLPYNGGWEVPSMEALVKIGDKYYASLKEAFADTDALTAAGGAVQISAPLTIEEGEEVTTEYTDTITIDLNGQTITYDGTDTAITAAGLVILDNSTIGTTDASGAIVAENAESAITATNLVIENGKINGPVTANNAGSIGGWFTINPADMSIVAEDHTVAELSDKDPYQYEIVEDTSFTVTVTAPGDGSHVSIASVVDADGAPVTPAEDGTVKTEKAITVTYKLDEGYILATGSAELVQELSADGAASVVPTAVLAVAQVGTEKYASIQDAIDANQGLDTEAAVEIKLVAEDENIDLAGFDVLKEKFKTKGLVIDFNGCIVNFISGAMVANKSVMEPKPYPIRVMGSDILTLKNGTIGLTASGEFGTEDLIRNYGTTLNLVDLTIDGTNLGGGEAITSLSGDINVLGSSSITAPTDGRIATIGDYTISYTVGTLTFDTTGTITGDLGLYGGKIDVKAIGTNNIGKYFFGATRNSTWADDADITEGGYFAARVGAIPEKTSGASYNEGGELFTTAAAAFAAVEAKWADGTEAKAYKACAIDLGDKGFIGLAAGEAVTISAAGVVADGALTFAGTIEGAVQAESIVIPTEKTITLATTGSLKTKTADLEKVLVADGTDREIKVEDAGDYKLYTNVEEAAPTPDPVDPSKPYQAKDETEAANIAEAFNAGTIDKALYLKAPNGVETTAEYLALFGATANGKNVAFALTEAAKTTLAADATADAAEALGEDGEITIKAVKGLWYGLKETASLETTMAVTDAEQANETTITFTPNKEGDAGFWQVIVSPTTIEVENN